MRHTLTDTYSKIVNMRGSKYVQSIIGNQFQQIKEYLKQGRKVLFTGRPCQVEGLHKYLGKNMIIDMRRLCVLRSGFYVNMVHT